VIRVACPEADPAAVYDHRTRWAAEHLQDTKQIELVAVEPPEIRYANRRYGPKEAVGVTNLPKADVMVLTRIIAGSLADMIPLIQREGIAVVVDIDDDYRHLPPMMEARHKIQPGQNPYYNWRHAARACRLADMVTCSTDRLLSWAPHGRGAVLQNSVPTRYLTIKGQKDGKTVGWSGSAASHPGDLQATRGGVARALAEVDGQFMVVGPRAGVRQALELGEEPHATGVVEHMRFAFKVAEFDVGIAPLSDNRFNEAKSWLKPLQYAALGIPFVASPTIEYSKFAINLPAGSYGLARPKGKDWYREVVRLLRMSQDERDVLGNQLREYTFKHHTVEETSWKWLLAWRAAADHRASQ
jgi:hypothetical protein